MLIRILHARAGASPDAFGVSRLWLLFPAVSSFRRMIHALGAEVCHLRILHVGAGLTLDVLGNRRLSLLFLAPSPP